MRGPKVSVNEIWSMKEWTWECSLSLGQVISSCCCFQMFMGSLSCACVLTTGLLKHTTASLASLCPFPCTVLFCGPCLPILKVQYLISLFSKSLQVWKTQNFVKVFFFFHSDFSIIWVIYGWDKLLGAVSATTATIPQEIRAALSYSAYSFMFLMMESVKLFLQLTFFWLWPAVQWKPEAWCERAITLHLALWPLISWFNLQPLIFDGWNW